MIKIKGPIYFLGDTHSIRITISTLFRAEIASATIIHVGDGGITDTRCLEPLDRFLKETNNTMIHIRGNHDNPAVFPHKQSDNLIFVDDYTTVEFESGERVLLVGGGMSIDRVLRVEPIDYWSGEPTKPVPEDLEHHDIVIAHDCPSWINCTTESLPDKFPRFCMADATLIGDCHKQRKVMDEIFEVVRPSQWYYGHYHNDDAERQRDCQFVCLNIQRLWTHAN